MTMTKPSTSRTLNILQVEDTRSDAVLTAHALKSAGIAYSIRVVANGEDAIDLLTQDKGFELMPRPDLVLLDVLVAKLLTFRRLLSASVRI
jgi:CheY-like chemotaxis protein